MIAHIQQKIGLLIQNAAEKIEAAETASKKNDFKTATALLVTAFEERTKAAVLQLVDIGFPIINQVSDLDYVFRQHDARHYFGYFADCFYEIIDDIKPLLIKMIQDKQYVFEIIGFMKNPKLMAEFTMWIFTKVDSFVDKLDFYQNIEKTRQSGLYIDVLNNGSLGTELGSDDYEFVKRRLNTVHLLSDDLKDMKIGHAKGELPALDDSKQEMLNHDIPTHIVAAIELVKKGRNKVFNDIREKLQEFQAMRNLE